MQSAIQMVYDCEAVRIGFACEEVVSSVIGDKSVAECRGSKQGRRCGCDNDRDGSPINNLLAFYIDHKGEISFECDTHIHSSDREESFTIEVCLATLINHLIYRD